MLTKFLLVLTLTLAGAVYVYGQSNLFTVSRYYGQTNRAELYIVEGKIDSAIIVYESILKTNKYLKYKDVYNLAVCYATTGNRTESIRQLEILSANGAKHNWFAGNAVLKQVINRKNELKFAKLEKKFLQKRLPLRDTLVGMYRTGPAPAGVQNADSENSENIINGDSINEVVFNKIIRFNKVIPGEEQLGINDSSLIDQPWNIFLMYQSNPDGIFDYPEIIYSSMKTGTMEPHLGVYLYTRTGGSPHKFGPFTLSKIVYVPDSIQVIDNANFDSTELYVAKFPWLVPFLDDSEMKMYDSIRLEVGLEPIKDYYKKARFLHDNANFKFYYGPVLSQIITCKTPGDAALFKQGLVELE